MVFIFTNSLPLGEFAKISRTQNDLIKSFMMKGKLYQINHMLDEEEIAEACMEHNLDSLKKNKNS